MKSIYGFDDGFFDDTNKEKDLIDTFLKSTKRKINEDKIINEAIEEDSDVLPYHIAKEME